jgi:DNA-binding winged helix-turn-helix (wHTH) protein/tetratricopeptide (TPR) repeat protein
MSMGLSNLYEFGSFRLDPRKRVLLRDGAPVSLTPKALETLVVLVENRERVLSKDDLMKKLWPDSFVEESNLSQNIFLLRKALGDSAQEKRYILTIPGRGYQFTEIVREVGAGEDAEAERNTVSAAAVEKEEKETLVVESIARSRVIVDQEIAEPVSSTKVLLRAALAVLAVAAVAAVVWAYRGRSQSDRQVASQSSAKIRHAVAVLGFRNLSRRPEEAWLSTALAEMLSTELAAGDQLRMIPGEEIVRASRDVPWGDTDTLAKDSLARLRAHLATDYVTLGSYTVLSEGANKLIRLDFRLQDAAAGETLAEDAVTGSEADLFDLIAEVGARMRKRLDIGQVTQEQSAQIRSSMPSNPKAARQYSEGLNKLWNFDTVAARDLFQQAVAADPDSPQPHASLSNAWHDLGYKTKAKDEMQRAFELSQGLSREEQLWIEAQYHDLNERTPGELQKAIELFHALADLYPDNLAYGLRLASLQDALGNPKEALATLEALRKLPSPYGDSPRIDLAEATSAEAVADYKREQRVSESAAEKGKARAQRLVVATARLYESSVLLNMGDSDKASPGFAEGKVLFAAAGDLNHSAQCLIWSGFAAQLKGDFDSARRQAEEALVIFRQIGYQGYVGEALNGIGEALASQGKLEEAKSYFEQSLKIYREINYKVVIGEELANLGDVQQGLEDLTGAHKSLAEAQTIFTEVGDRHAVGSAALDLGSIAFDRGDLAEAATDFEKALQLGKESDSKRLQANSLLAQASLLLQQDALPAANDKANLGLTIFHEIGDNDGSGQALAKLVVAQIESGKLTEAQQSAMQAVKVVENSKSPPTVAGVYAVLARAQLTQQQLEQARSASQQASAAAAKASNRAPKLEAELAAAAVDASSGKAADSRRRLTQVLSESTKLGVVPYEFQARLALGDLALHSGDGATGRAQLEALAKDAREKGFLLIARKASAPSAAQVAQSH